MATTTYGTEYVQSSDLVSNWPGSSLSVANRIDNVSLVGNGVNNQTGTSYTLVLADGGKLVTFSNAAAVSLTVPTNASVAFPTGVRIKLTNKGAGTVTVAGAGGVTLNGNQLTVAQNRSAMLYKLDTNTWVMTADPSIPSDPGLGFITSSTFSASSAVNVNNCFSSTYDTYQIRVSFTNSAVSDNISVRLRVGGTDTVGTGYTWQRFIAGGTTSAAVVGTGAGLWQVGGMDSNSRNTLRLDVFDPAATVATTFQGQNQNGLSTGQIRLTGGFHTGATAFDGFSLIPDAGTVTGTLRVYGFRNS